MLQTYSHWNTVMTNVQITVTDKSAMVYLLMLTYNTYITEDVGDHVVVMLLCILPDCLIRASVCGQLIWHASWLTMEFDISCAQLRSALIRLTHKK